jgi:hypothetical protein
MKPVAFLALAILVVLVGLAFAAWLNPETAATLMNQVGFCG